MCVCVLGGGGVSLYDCAILSLLAKYVKDRKQHLQMIQAHSTLDAGYVVPMVKF